MVGLAIDSVDYCCTACKLFNQEHENVIWTFSGGSSTDERSVVQQFDHRKATPVLCPRKLREYALTSGLAPGIGSSYVVYYLSMRVYSATVSESLLATLAGAYSRPNTTTTPSSERDEIDMLNSEEPKKEANTTESELTLSRTVLLIVPVIRTGAKSAYIVDKTTSTALSHVLCSPIADPPIDNTDLNGSTTTLRQLLTSLRDTTTINTTTSKSTLEQAILVPTILQACTYNCYAYGVGVSGNEIQSLQNRHVDKLALSGKLFLPTIMSEFERLGIWDEFMSEEQRKAERTDAVVARDATLGHYGTHNVRDQLRDNVVKS
ncbi:hypothetical protein BDZ45DRAFT_693935 [Acephala macrosclerotiorum]|nr:hypothetical protein BDZ45DRAFT_693935 [Acephala macrosclerotiorum]